MSEADDELPVDEGWLRAVGVPYSTEVSWRSGGYPGSAMFLRTAVLLSQANDEGEAEENWSCIHINYRTRGDVRNLCKALRISLKGL